MKSHSNKSAWEVALTLLAGRDFSRSEMEERLARRDFDEIDIQQAVQKLLKYDYIAETGNDEKKLREMVEEYIRKKGAKNIEKKHLRSLESFLIRKGFNIDIVQQYLEDLNEELT